MLDQKTALAALATLLATTSPLAAQTPFEAFVDAMCDAGQLSGVAASWQAEGADILQTCAAPDIPQMGADQPFYIASIAKAFTATLVLQQADEGVLELDAPVSHYVDGLIPELGDAITLRHLLTHTSGLMRDHTEALAPGTSGDDVDAMFAALNQVGLLSAPGERYIYSNTGYRLLAHVLETVSGLSYEQLLQTRIVRPAGLSIATTTQPQTRPVQGYTRPDLLTPVPQPAEGLPGAGQVFSTASDLHRFTDALSNGTLLSDAARDLLFSPIEAEDTDGSDAMGWTVYPLDDDVQALIATGAADGYISILVFTRGATDRRFVYLLNDSSPGRQTARALLLGGLQTLVFGAEEIPNSPPAPLAHALELIRAGETDQALAYVRSLDMSDAPVASAAASQAVGEPDGGVGETAYAWAPATADAGEEWLRLGFTPGLEAAQVEVHFTQIPDAFAGLDINDAPSGLTATASTSEAGAPVLTFTLAEPVPVEAVTIHLDTAATPGWPQIDAIALIGSEGQRVWADSATASTSAFDASDVSMHDLPTASSLDLLARRLEENGHGTLAGDVREFATTLAGAMPD